GRRMVSARHYQPTLDSVRQHPLPGVVRRRQTRHFGLYSVPGCAASRVNLHRVLAEGGFDRYFRENPYAEWYLNSMKFEDGPTRAYHDRTFGPRCTYEGFASTTPAAWTGPPSETEICIRDLRVVPAAQVHLLGGDSRLDWRQDGADLIVCLASPLAGGAAHTFAISPPA